MRRTPLRRGSKRLARQTRVRSRRTTRRRSSRVHSERYLDTCRSSKTPDVMCYVALELGVEVVGPCSGPIEPDHQRDMTGGGKRESDELSYPCCRGHHDRVERFDIPGAETKSTRKTFRFRLIAKHHRFLARRGFKFLGTSPQVGSDASRVSATPPPPTP